METKIFRVSIKVNFDIDATSEEVAREMANNECIEWLRNVENIEDEDINIKLLSS